VSDSQPRTDRKWLSALLLAATLATTTLTGACHWISFEADFQAVDSGLTLWAVANGLWYSLTILTILGAHELGHYLACRHYRINASLPYFLPIPFPLTGTAGAFIRIRQPITAKRALFDIGIAGPLAGFAFAVPALVLGLALSRVVEVPSRFTGLSLGEPLLFKAVSWLIWGSPPESMAINMHPMAFAAWFGLLATGLNLLPIGQFDGGHIAYATLGRHAHKVTITAVLAAVGLSAYSSSWIMWTLLAVGLLFAFGWRHPPVWDEDEPLDASRRWLAVLALVILVLCFTPAPIEPLDLLQPK
jgi:membrane-associated protease RseP (regulator of RpoE activity)